MASTEIEWATDVWNTVTGCEKVSPGCKHCYAETVAKRFWKGRKFTDVRCHPERLAEPLRWRKPRRVFVNSMSDLFHEDVHRDFILRVFLTMAACPKHDFLILTKRPERMKDMVAEWLAPAMQIADGPALRAPTWPLLNVWLGVSVEDQQRADERIPVLLNTPAAVRFLSCEPLLGPLDLNLDILKYDINWVIVGGESGPGARPCNLRWVYRIKEQCADAGVALFVKQLGARPGIPSCASFDCTHPDCDPGWLKLKDKKGGDPAEWPEDLRVREFPLAPSRLA